GSHHPAPRRRRGRGGGHPGRAVRPDRLRSRRAYVTSERCSWIERIAADPSPTAAATRFVEPERRSPTAKSPGLLVSYGSGDRPSALHSCPSPSAMSARSVSTKPCSSTATWGNHELLGSAPMKEKRAEQSRSTEALDVETVTPSSTGSP